MPRYAAAFDKSTFTVAILVLGAVILAVPSRGLAQERLRGDPRAALPGAPHSIEELRDRFHPALFEVVHADEIVVGAERPGSIELPTDVGRCYVAMAVAPAEEDVDLRLEEAGVVSAITLSRDSYPTLEWCATQRRATLIVTAARRQVDVSVAVFRDANTDAIPANVIPGGALNARLLAFWARVAPRWVTRTSPQTLTFESPKLMPVVFEPQRESCALILAVADGAIADVDLVIRQGARSVAGSYDPGTESALLYCGPWEADFELVVGVRRGDGDVRVIVLYPASP